MRKIHIIEAAALIISIVVVCISSEGGYKSKISKIKHQYGYNYNKPLENPQILDESEFRKRQLQMDAEEKRNPRIHMEANKKDNEILLQEKEKLDSEFNDNKKIEDENDIKAGEILRKFYNRDISVLTYDKYEDYKTMWLIVDAIKQSRSFTAQEVKILKNYLKRRYNYINDNPDLKRAINELGIIRNF